MGKPWYKKWWMWVLLVVLATGIVFGVLVFLEIRRLAVAGELGPNTRLERYNSETLAWRFKIESNDDPELGRKSAPITIVEFGDFECPFCAASYQTIRELERQYRDRVRLVYRDFPIEALHAHALMAHKAANCAFDQGKFWAMHDKIYENREHMEEADLKRYAVQIGLNETLFAECFLGDKKTDEIYADLRDGVDVGVEGTPTWFVNGYKIEGVLTLSQWRKLISGMLAEYEREEQVVE